MPQGFPLGKAGEDLFMTKIDPPQESGKPAKPGAKKPAKKQEREARSAQALRENLKRRKRQIQARADESTKKPE